MPMRLLSTLCQREGQLEVGQYYLIRGTANDDLPVAPQIFYLQEKMPPSYALGIPQVRGILWLSVGGQSRQLNDHTIWLPDVNIPDHGVHDLHMEHIADDQVSRLYHHDQRQGIDTEQHRDTFHPRCVPVNGKVYKPWRG